MPSSTFIKLPEAKRNKFIKTALEEFAKYDYERASVSEIVKKLDIAKGSVYQYFENKKDLYFYLLELANQKKLEYVRPVLKSPPDNFREFYIKLYEANLNFDIDNPLWSKLLFNAGNEMFSDDLGNLKHQMKMKSLDFNRGLLERELLWGGLRNDADLELMTFIVAQITGGIHDYLSIKFNINDEERMNPKKLRAKLPNAELKNVLGKMADLMLSGLKGK